MINFRHRHDWAPGCPDVWPSIILDMSVEVFVDESVGGRWYHFTFEATKEEALWGRALLPNGYQGTKAQ